MVEILGIATELAERRKRIAALQSPSVRARVIPTTYSTISDDVKRLTAENSRLLAENAKLTEEVERLRDLVRASQSPGRLTLQELSDRQAVLRICAVFAKHYGVHGGGIIEHVKQRPFVRARYAVYLFMAERMGFTKIKVARSLNRDHHTIGHGLKLADKLRKADPAWLVRYEEASAELLPAPLAEAA